MGGTRILKSSQEQAAAAWINHLNQLRFQDLAQRLAKQDINFDQAMAELQLLKGFIADPTHILGRPDTKHGEIAEWVQVRFANAEKLILGQKAVHTFEGVLRTAPEDYLRGDHMVQSKFYMGLSGTLRAIGVHLDNYPWFVEQGGIYDIPKNQYEEIIKIYRNGLSGAFNNSSDQKMFEAIKEWEATNNLVFDKTVFPAKVSYYEVQLDTVQSTIEAETEQIEETDRRIRDNAHSDTKPTVKEGARVTIVAALLEGGVAFAVGVYKKRKGGKKIASFTAEDWKEIGADTGLSTVKGAIRGVSVYALTNFTPTPAPVASAMVTATLGVLAQAYKLHTGEITPEEFVDASEAMCLEVTISALSSLIGEVFIPVPVLGAIIGNTVGMFMLNIAQAYLSNEEEKLIENYRRDMATLVEQLDNEYKEFIAAIEKDMSEFRCLAALAFDPDVNVRFETSVALARQVGVKESRILHQDDWDRIFNSNKPVTL